ncbi:MAG: hypothetical protein ABI210_05500 [Abditibacteriaceae bacterium]
MHTFQIMGINSPENQYEDYGDVWPKVYRVIALIILVPILIYLVGLLITALGILLQFILAFVLFIIFGICLSIAFRFLFG